MPHHPTPEAFRSLASGVDYVPVWRRLVSDALTPVSAFQALERSAGDEPPPVACLFESVIGGEKVGRYSFLATEPYRLIEARGKAVTLTTFGEAGGGVDERTVREADNPLDVLREELAAVRVAKPAGLPPFVGGAIGYAGYDTVRYVENLPDAPADDRDLPDLAFGLFDHLLVFDNVDKTLTVIALAPVKGLAGEALSASYTAAMSRVDRYIERLATADHGLSPADIDTGGPPPEPPESNFTRQRFEAAVERCVEYIRAGDIFQVVLSQRFATPLPGDPFELYRTLRVVNPSPFMFYVRTPDCTLVGSSPEIMVRVAEGEVTVRPLAGTRRRGADEAEDQRLATELLADPKERAEHVMLVDLGRNDVGRVARFGTV